MKRAIQAILVAACLTVTPLIAQATTPDATIDVKGTSVAAGVGFTQTDGTVHFQGKAYPVRLEGLSVGELGAQKISATGEVFNLRRIEDLDGNYAAVSAGAAIGSGTQDTTMRNQKGVEIKLHGTAEGVNLKLSVDGLLLTVAK